MTKWTATFFILIVVGCSIDEQKTTTAIEAARRLPLEVCKIDGIEEPLLCGSFDALEDWDNPESGKISIAVVVVPAKNGNPDNLAWTEHQGGPGRRMLNTAAYYSEGGSLERFRENRDIVLFDQRGVGESGGLYCEALSVPPILEPYYTSDKVRACREELTRGGVDLANYSTLAAIDDLEGIRKWLGYEPFDVGGWSYGSRFMLTYANRYPRSIRTLTVAVPTTFDYRRPLDWARFSEASLEGLFADCKSEVYCDKDFPALAEDFAKVLADLETSPATVSYINPVSRKNTTVAVDRMRFVEEIHVGLLRVERTTMLPLVIHEAATGNFEPFLELAVPGTPPQVIAEAEYLSVVCPEETAFFSPEEAQIRSAGTFVGTYFTSEFKEACLEWELPAHPQYPIEWIRPDVPTLVVSGDRDPITPVEYGDEIAASLNNALHLKIHRMPHDFSGLQGASCLDDIIFLFLQDKDLSNLDTSCLSTIEARPFARAIPN